MPTIEIFPSVSLRIRQKQHGILLKPRNLTVLLHPHTVPNPGLSSLAWELFPGIRGDCQTYMNRTQLTADH